MLNPRHRLVWFVSAVVLSATVVFAVPSTAAAATFNLNADCQRSPNVTNRDVSPSVGDTLNFTVSNGSTCTVTVKKAIVDSVSDVTVTGTSITTDHISDVSAFTWNGNITAVSLTFGGTGGPGRVDFDDDSTAPNEGWFFAASGSSGGSSSSSDSSNTGCEVAGKPCAVRPWPWPIAYTDYINVSWEALIPAEAGTGGVTSYRVESTPAGGTCILRLSEVAAGESLPTTCNITGLETDTDYTFTVYASSAYGEGPGRSTQEPIRLLSATTPAVTVPAVTPETPAPTLPATGQHTVLVGAAVLLIGLGALAALSVRRRRDLSQMAQAIPHP